MAITKAQQARQMLRKGSMKPVEQAGVINYMPSEMVTVPKIAKSSPDTPTAKLAYITPEEQDILIDLNLYGSLDGKPNRGPGGIPSLEGDFESYTSGLDKAMGRSSSPPPGSPDYNRTARTITPKLPPGVQKAVDEGRPTSIKTKEDERKAKKEVQEFLKETGQKKSFIETFNEKKRKKNEEYLRNLRNKKFEGIAAAYGLSTEQMQKLLDAYNEDEDEFDLSDFRSIVDAGGPPSIISSDPNFLKAQELALSKGMAKGNKLSTGALFSTEDPTTRIDLPGVLGKVQGPETFSNVLSGLNRIQTLDEIIDKPGGVTQSDIDNYFNLTMGKGGTDPVTDKPVDALFTPRDDDGPSQVTDPCKGPNPPAYCFANVPSDPTTPPTSPRNLGGLAPRFAGSIFDFTGMADGGRIGAAEGGIMDLETGRQMYFLGKLVKKATRAVKKITKSPLGKAAILGGLAYFGGGGGGFTSLLKKGFLKDTAGKFALENLSPLKTIGIVSALSGLMATQEEEEKITDRGPELSMEELIAIRNNPFGVTAPRFEGSTFAFAADGGRIGYQEGSKEPVAKKTMPLLDMGGQEMDLRDNGGFVPIGRMEKADDVPARLSKNEFVFTADAVRNAGDGDVDKGAEVMYNMMKNLESGGEVSEESQGLEGARKMFQTSKRLEEVI